MYFIIVLANQTLWFQAYFELNMRGTIIKYHKCEYIEYMKRESYQTKTFFLEISPWNHVTPCSPALMVLMSAYLNTIITHLPYVFVHELPIKKKLSSSTCRAFLFMGDLQKPWETLLTCSKFG